MKKYDHTWLIAEWYRMGRPPCECKGKSEQWSDVSGTPKFHSKYQYRIKCKPSINWEHVSDEFNWLSTDASGYSYLYDVEPKKTSYGYAATLDYTSVVAHKSFIPGTCGWKDSLFMRPVVIGEEK